MPLLVERVGTRLVQIEYRKGFDGGPEIGKIWLRDQNGMLSLKPDRFDELKDFGFDLHELNLLMEERLDSGEEE